MLVEEMEGLPVVIDILMDRELDAGVAGPAAGDVVLIAVVKVLDNRLERDVAWVG